MLDIDAIIAKNNETMRDRMAISEKSSTIIISLRTTKYLETVRAYLSKLYGEVTTKDQRLILVRPYETARKIAAAIEQWLFNFNIILAKSLPGKEWLAEYSTHYNLGIRSVNVDNFVSGISDDQSERFATTDVKARLFHTQVEAAKAAATTYKKENFITTFTNIACDSWGKSVPNALWHDTMAQIFGALESISADMIHVSEYASLKLTMAMECRANALDEMHLNSDDRRLIQKGKENRFYKTQVADLLDKGAKHTVCQSCQRSVETILNSLDGFSPSVDVAPSIHLNQLVDLSLIHDDFAKQLAPNSIKGGSATPAKYIAGAICDYYLRICEVKANAHFERHLREFSKEMDSRSFYEAWPQLLKAAKPAW